MAPGTTHRKRDCGKAMVVPEMKPGDMAMDGEAFAGVCRDGDAVRFEKSSELLLVGGTRRALSHDMLRMPAS